MKTLFISSGPYEWNSSRLRCFWPASHMEGATVVEFKEYLTSPGDYGGYDAYVFQKNINVKCVRELRKAGKPVWWDVCDPTWWWLPNPAREIAESVTGAVASNQPLADDYTDWCGLPCETIEDRIELEHFPKVRQHQAVSPVRFVWVGFSVNHISLYAAINNLERLAANGHAIEITTVSERSVGGEIAGGPVYYAGSLIDEELNTVMSAHDIALTPPYPGPWGKVKSNNKVILAWANGLPHTTGEDYKKLVSLMDWTERKRLGLQYRRWVEAGWTADKSAREWEALLCASS